MKKKETTKYLGLSKSLEEAIHKKEIEQNRTFSDVIVDIAFDPDEIPTLRKAAITLISDVFMTNEKMEFMKNNSVSVIDETTTKPIIYLPEFIDIVEAEVLEEDVDG